MRIRFITTAAPLLVAGALAAAAPGLSQAAGTSQPDGEAAPQAASGAARMVATSPCTGGTQKKAFSGGHADWFSTSSSSVVPGAQYQFQGPKKKKDTVFVTVTAPSTFAGTADYGRVRVLLDGVAMKPATSLNEYFYDDTNYASFAGQYCAKVGKGLHRVRVVLDSFDGNASGSDTAYLLNPMLHVEVAE